MVAHWRERLSVALAVLSVAVLLPVATLLVFVWLFGWQLVSVHSGSMAPAYPVGAMLVIEPIDASRVEPGMTISFADPALPDRLVAHRVVGRVPGDALRFWTQGDGNPARDANPVAAGDIRGRVLWSIPHLGAVTNFLQWPWSAVLLVVLPAGLLVAGELRGRGQARNASGEPSNAAG